MVRHAAQRCYLVWSVEAGGGAGAFANGACVGALESSFFFLVIRVLGCTVVAGFFFLVAVSPASPSGADCVWRSATSAASGGAGASLSSCGPLTLAFLGTLARSANRTLAGFAVLPTD